MKVLRVSPDVHSSALVEYLKNVPELKLVPASQNCHVLDSLGIIDSIDDLDTDALDPKLAIRALTQDTPMLHPELDAAITAAIKAQEVFMNVVTEQMEADRKCAVVEERRAIVRDAFQHLDSRQQRQFLKDRKIDRIDRPGRTDRQNNTYSLMRWLESAEITE